MKKLTLSILSALAITTVAVAGTIAYFTSHQVASGNTFTSGTLKVEANGNAGSGTFTYNLGTIDHIAPADVTDAATITVKNIGNLNTASFGRFTVSGDTGLSNALKLYEYKVEYFNADGTPAARWATHDPYYGTAINEDYWIKDGVIHPLLVSYGASDAFLSWISGNGALDMPGTPWDMEALKPGEYYTMTFKFQMDPLAGNEYQGKEVSIGYEVKATQINVGALNALGLGAGDMTVHMPYLESQVTP